MSERVPHFQEELEALQHRLLEMGGLAEERVRAAVRGLVTRDVAPGSIVAGNPARVVRTGIKTYRYGCLWNWESTKYGGTIPDP